MSRTVPPPSPLSPLPAVHDEPSQAEGEGPGRTSTSIYSESLSKSGAGLEAAWFYMD
jgi:hypothetical protein